MSIPELYSMLTSLFRLGSKGTAHARVPTKHGTLSRHARWYGTCLSSCTSTPDALNPIPETSPLISSLQLAHAKTSGIFFFLANGSDGGAVVFQCLSLRSHGNG